jgi:hypothetical protein
MGEHGDENAPIVGAVIDNENSFHGLTIAAASVQPTGAEITYFEFVKLRKSRLSKTAFGNPKGSNQNGKLTLSLRPHEKQQPDEVRHETYA